MNAMPRHLRSVIDSCTHVEIVGDNLRLKHSCAYMFAVD
jgi:hypothetical protein